MLGRVKKDRRGRDTFRDGGEGAEGVAEGGGGEEGADHSARFHEDEDSEGARFAKVTNVQSLISTTVDAPRTTRVSEL